MIINQLNNQSVISDLMSILNYELKRIKIIENFAQ